MGVGLETPQGEDIAWSSSRNSGLSLNSDGTSGHSGVIVRPWHWWVKSVHTDITEQDCNKPLFGKEPQVIVSFSPSLSSDLEPSNKGL